MRADSGFYPRPIVAPFRDKGVRYSITVRQPPILCNLIEAIPEKDWIPISYWIDNAAWLAAQCLPRARYGAMAHNLARWAGRIGLGEPGMATKTLRRRYFSSSGRVIRNARRLTLAWPNPGPGKPVHQRSVPTTRPASTFLSTPLASDTSSECPIAWPKHDRSASDFLLPPLNG